MAFRRSGVRIPSAPPLSSFAHPSLVQAFCQKMRNDSCASSIRARRTNQSWANESERCTPGFGRRLRSFRPINTVKKAKPEKSGRQRLKKLLTRISVFLLVYVLSIGPVVWVCDHTRNPYLKDAFECLASFVYWPVSTVANRVGPLQYVLNGYVSIWS